MAESRRRTEEQLLLALACGASAEAAARATNLSPRTVFRRLKDPDFLRRLDKIRADLVSRTSDMLTAAGGESVKTLVALQKETMPPSVRLGAARACVELGIKVREITVLEKRIAALEAQLAEPKPPGRKIG